MQQVQQIPELPQLPPPPQLPQNPQNVHNPRIAQAPAPSGDIASMELAQLRAHADALKLRLNDLDIQRGQIADDRANASPAERQKFAKPWADVNHELTSVRIQLDATARQISELEAARDQARAAVISVPPPVLAERGIEMDMARERMIGAAAFILLRPLVIAASRRLWHRGRPQPAVDLEASPRLQRMEQAIESIALEVERIGEAQRFTTKLLAERQPDAAARLGVTPRREPGTITPH